MNADDLAARAASRRIVVLGGSLGALVAARECAKVGLPVTVLGAADPAETAIDRFSLRGGHVQALLAEVGLDGDVIPAPPITVPGAGSTSSPLPAESILGIPANPFAEDVRAVIGWRGAWRAYLDRLRPPLTIGAEQSLGRLVRTRMGARVHERLLEPAARAEYGVGADDINTDAAIPGLNAALTRVGSLSGAIAVLRGENPALGAPAATLRGGLATLAAALRDDLATLGAELVPAAHAIALQRAESGWIVTATVPAPEGEDTEVAGEMGDTAAERRWHADAVISAQTDSAVGPEAALGIATVGAAPGRRSLMHLIPDAIEVADGIRRTLLWGSDTVHPASDGS